MSSIKESITFIQSCYLIKIMSSNFQSNLKNNAEKFKSSQMLNCGLVNSY